jgi:hypothetical protein
MSESKQTVVEFYRSNLMALVSTGKTDFKTEPEIFEQAKEIFEQQIIDARQSGINAAINGKSISNIDYYNETYGGDNK